MKINNQLNTDDVPVSSYKGFSKKEIITIVIAALTGFVIIRILHGLLHLPLVLAAYLTTPVILLIGFQTFGKKNGMKPTEWFLKKQRIKRGRQIYLYRTEEPASSGKKIPDWKRMKNRLLPTGMFLLLLLVFVFILVKVFTHQPIATGTPTDATPTQAETEEPTAGRLDEYESMETEEETTAATQPVTTPVETTTKKPEAKTDAVVSTTKKQKVPTTIKTEVVTTAPKAEIETMTTAQQKEKIPVVSMTQQEQSICSILQASMPTNLLQTQNLYDAAEYKTEHPTEQVLPLFTSAKSTAEYSGYCTVTSLTEENLLTAARALVNYLIPAGVSSYQQYGLSISIVTEENYYTIYGAAVYVK